MKRIFLFGLLLFCNCKHICSWVQRQRHHNSENLVWGLPGGFNADSAIGLLTSHSECKKPSKPLRLHVF